LIKPSTSWVYIKWMLIIAAYFVSSFAFLIWQAKRTFRQYKALSDPYTIEIRSDGLYFSRQKGQGLLSWDEVIQWKQNNQLVLLYPTSNLYYVIPASVFQNSAHFQSFKELLISQLGNARL
jgi:hypothetical protein